MIYAVFRSERTRSVGRAVSLLVAKTKISAPAGTRRKRIVHNSFPVGSHLSR